MNTLYLIRGVSGSGKTTLAKELESVLPAAMAIAADDYFYDENNKYSFDATKLAQAHGYCRKKVALYMEVGLWRNIIVHNTFTREREMEPYLNLAKDYGYKVVSLVVENRHGNKSVHDVPEEVLQAQARRFSLKL